MANLTIENGGSVDVRQQTFVGCDPNGQGTIEITGGHGQFNNGIYVGGSETNGGGQGLLSMSGGTANIGSELAIWENGTVEIRGGTVSVQSYVLDADGGSLANSGTFNHTGGTLEIDGGTFDNGGFDLIVSSSSGKPTLRLANGATADQDTLALGEFAGELGRLEHYWSRLPTRHRLSRCRRQRWKWRLANLRRRCAGPQHK